jgi:hypothetical protein
MKNNHTHSGIRTHDPRNQADKTYALEREATGTGNEELYTHHNLYIYIYIYIYMTSEISTTKHKLAVCSADAAGHVFAI